MTPTGEVGDEIETAPGWPIFRSDVAGQFRVVESLLQKPVSVLVDAAHNS